MLKGMIVKSLVITALSISAAYAALSKEDTEKLAQEGYIYAYPLVLMNLTKDVMTNVEKPNDEGHAPLNQFSNVKAFPEPDDKDVIRVNLDTLYSTAWLDVEKEPMVVSIPDSQARYYLLPMLDMWTNVFSSVGKRTTGTQAGNYALVGPKWKGKLPKGVKQIKAPTNNVWIIGRTQTNGKQDYAAVHEFQKGLKITPLSAWGKEDYEAPKAEVNASLDMKTPPPEQIAKMDGITFFKTFSKMLQKNGPLQDDKAILAKLKEIGIVAGKEFDESKLSDEQKEIIKNIPATVLKSMASFAQDLKQVNGWSLPKPPMGTYGTDYVARASVALFGLGANLMEDAVYLSSSVDEKAKQLNGKNNYTIHFAKGKTPPARAFWSLTMYDPKGYLVPNSINRFAIGDRDKIKLNQDGSLDLYIQEKNPGAEKESNWLPAPEGDFNVLMRLYWPREDAIKGVWVPSAVQMEKQ